MKQWKMIVAAVAAAFVLMGCAALNGVFNPSGQSRCSEPEFATGSLICKVCTEYNTTPEAMHGFLLDGAAISAYIIYPEQRLSLCEFLADLNVHYNQVVFWDSLIEFTELQAEQRAALRLVLQRRIPLSEFNVVRYISEEDDWYLVRAWEDHWQQLGCEALIGVE